MSTEIQIGFPCPHYIMEEVGQLDTDNRTVLVSSPIVSETSTVVLINNELYVPKEGLYSQAYLTSSSKGPYNIEPCTGLIGPDGNLLTVQTPKGSVQVRLPEGKRLSLLEVQKFLRLSAVNDYVEVVDYNGALALQERFYLGEASFIRVGGKGATALGFIQKGSRGKTLYPGWELVKDETVIPYQSNPRRVSTKRLRFRSPIVTNPSIKLSYTTQPTVCVRCKGTYVENDYRFNPQGEILTIQNENLLIQACIKMVLTEKGSNLFHVGYGTDVMTRVGRKVVSDVVQDLKEDIIKGLQKIQNIQRKQRQYQDVTAKEFLYSIDAVEIYADEYDVTKYFIDVVLRNGSNEPVSISITYTAPGAIALAGSNGLSLGTETLK